MQTELVSEATKLWWEFSHPLRVELLKYSERQDSHLQIDGDFVFLDIREEVLCLAPPLQPSQDGLVVNHLEDVTLGNLNVADDLLEVSEESGLCDVLPLRQRFMEVLKERCQDGHLVCDISHLLRGIADAFVERKKGTGDGGTCGRDTCHSGKDRERIHLDNILPEQT